MKRILIIASFILAFSIASFGQSNNTPGVDKREKKQTKRIFKGVKKGKLTGKETGKLLKQQAKIRKAERKAKKDGKVTLVERVRLHHKLNKSSRNIRRKKNN